MKALFIALISSLLLYQSYANIQGELKWYQTTGDQKYLFQEMGDVIINLKKSIPDYQVNVDTTKQYQEMIGFGAALTEASAWLFATQLSSDNRQHYLEELYSSTKGIGLNVLRLPVGASDFAIKSYTYDDMPAGKTDPDLQNFSLDHDKATIIPVLQQILTINPNVWIVSSPWSPPAWMKTTDTLQDGEVKVEYYQQFAEYYAKFLLGYKQQGIKISAMAIQNEPFNTPCDYPCTHMSPQNQALFIKQYMVPTLQKYGLNYMQILIWDHNWDVAEFPLTVLADQDVRSLVTGVAWHGYNGDVSNQTFVHNQYPGIGTYFTEISGGQWSPDFVSNLEWYSQVILIGTVINYSKNVLFWNLALDQNYGPHDGGCDDCRGVFTIFNPTNQSVVYNVEYYVLAHASKFVKQGAIRIGAEDPTGTVDSEAFKNPDGSIVVIAYNSLTQPINLGININGYQYIAQIQNKSLVTFIWTPFSSSIYNQE